MDPRLALSFSSHEKDRQNKLITQQPPICTNSAASSMAKGERKGDCKKSTQWDLSVRVLRSPPSRGSGMQGLSALVGRCSDILDIRWRE